MEKHRSILLGLFVAVLANSASAEWNTYQGNPAHDGYVPGTLNMVQPQLLWKTPVSSDPLNGIAVGGGAVFVTNTTYFTNIDGLHALDQTSGAPLWSVGYGSRNDTVSAPAYANGRVYLQTDGHSSGIGNYLHAYVAGTGANVFNASYDAQWETYLNPTPYAGNVYTGGGYYGGIYSFNGTTGAQNWFGIAGQYDGWTPAVDANYCYLYTGSGSTSPVTGQFRIINRSTGVTQTLVSDSGYVWAGYTMHAAVTLGTHEDAFAINSAGGRLLMVDLHSDATHTPHIAWTLSRQFTGQPTLANGVLYAIDGGNLVALDELTGQTLWNWAPPSGKLAGTMIATDNLLLASTGTATFAVDLNSHLTSWSYPMGGILALSDSTVYIAGTDNAVYALGVPEPAALSVMLAATTLLLRRRRAGRQTGN